MRNSVVYGSFSTRLRLLQKLPKLHDAVTRNRKTNNPIVLGFQGRSQLRKHYGIDAEVMFSQPATKIFLRTSEPESAKWISDAIGEVEIEQVRESRTSDQSPRYRQSRSGQLERRIEPLVLPSEVMGLEDRHGYLKFGNAVARLRFPYLRLPKTQPAIIERVTDTPRLEPPKAAAAAAGANGSPKPNGNGPDAKATGPSVSSGEDRRTQRNATQTAFLRIELNAHHLEAAQRRSGPRVSSGGIQQRARQLLHRRRTDYRASGTADWPKNGDCREKCKRSTSGDSVTDSIRRQVTNWSAIKPRVST